MPPLRWRWLLLMAVSVSSSIQRGQRPDLLLAVTANFDIDRLAEKVKNTRVIDGDPDDLSHDHLAKFFSLTALGAIDCPSTVVDEHGRVILWYLPDIIAPFRVVSEILAYLLLLHPCLSHL